MKLSVLLLLICLAVGAPAQDKPELVELQTQELSTDAWQDLQQQLRMLRGSLRLGVRADLTRHSVYSLHQVQYRLPGEELLLVHRRDWDGKEDLFSASFRAWTPRAEIALGHWRARFGRGLLLGDGLRSTPDSVINLREPLSPQTCVPLGLAALASYRAWRLGLFASRQMRDASLDDSLLASLPSTHGGSLSQTRESLAGLSLGYQNAALQAAGLLYWQSYDRAWNDPELPRRLLAGSFYAALNLGGHRLDGELAWLEGVPYGLLAWNYRRGAFSQTLSYARNAPLDILPYASSAARLDSCPGRSEYAWSLGLAPLPHTKLQLRYSLNSGSGFTGDPLSRFSAALQLNRKDSWIRLTGHLFDRELIARLDSTYSSTLPRNYRLLLAARHRFLSRFFQQLDLLWSLADRASFTRQTYRFRLSLGYEPTKILGHDIDGELRIGLLSWQSPRTFLAADELDPDYYSVCESEDNQLFATASLRRGYWQSSLSAQRSLLRPRDFRLNLRLGWSLF